MGLQSRQSCYDGMRLKSLSDWALALSDFEATTKKPLTRVSKRVPGVHGKRVGEGLAEKVGKGLAKGW